MDMSFDEYKTIPIEELTAQEVLHDPDSDDALYSADSAEDLIKWLNDGLSIDIDIEKTCCFTGHRPEKINTPIEIIKKNLEKEIRHAIDLGYDTFLTGMASGTDTWAAEIVLNLKAKGTPIRLACAIPFKGVERNRSEELQKRFHEILDAADDAVYMSKKYARWVFLSRDEWMVENSSYVIAVYNGTKGGTEFAVDYAKKMGRTVVFTELEG